MKHAIFSFSSNASESKKDGFDMVHDSEDKRDIYTAELENRMNLASIQDDEKIYVDRLQERGETYSPMTTEVRNIGNSEDPLPTGLCDDSSDSKDLARNGLPSACVFVAKFECYFPTLL